MRGSLFVHKSGVQRSQATPANISNRVHRPKRRVGPIVFRKQLRTSQDLPKEEDVKKLKIRAACLERVGLSEVQLNILEMLKGNSEGLTTGQIAQRLNRKVEEAKDIIFTLEQSDSLIFCMSPHWQCVQGLISLEGMHWIIYENGKKKLAEFKRELDKN